ncbi:MAG TPA: protein-disulfide reductase DsbD domain-containing protein, partial [Amaricoccus sp.]|nr:protein-disulfide reductase DsbD domain-containing protein [Amaricoccus sp.]
MRLTASALVLALLAALPAAAQIAPWAVVSVDLLDGWREPDGSRLAALEIVLAPGWHTYWRVPGAAGIPPRFDWSGSANLASVAYEWPRPAVFERFGLRSFGFADRLVLPLRLRPRDASAPVDLALAVDFGVCDDICMPASAELAGRIAPDTPEEGRARIEAALADRPRSAGEAGVAAVACGLARLDHRQLPRGRIGGEGDPGGQLVAVRGRRQPAGHRGDAGFAGAARAVGERGLDPGAAFLR